MMNNPEDIEFPVVEPIDLSLETAVDHLVLVEVNDDGMWLATGEIPDTEGVTWTYPKCPNPTKWKLVGQAKATGQFHVVSPAVSGKAAPATYTFKVQRSITFSAAVSAGVKVNLHVLEEETGIKLETSVTVSTSDSVSYTVPKGHVMALFAGCGYIVRTFQRVVYGSAMCNKVVQTTQVMSPYIKILEVRNV